MYFIPFDNGKRKRNSQCVRSEIVYNVFESFQIYFGSNSVCINSNQFMWMLWYKCRKRSSSYSAGLWNYCNRPVDSFTVHSNLSLVKLVGRENESPNLPLLIIFSMDKSRKSSHSLVHCCRRLIIFEIKVWSFDNFNSLKERNMFKNVTGQGEK